MMATQWITAANALSIVAQQAGRYEAQLALCTRAHLGLVKTRATAFTIDGERRDPSAIPSGFWWAKGHEALEQNWPTGDFSTWINKQHECRAFGVAFDLEGVLSLVPVESHSGITLSLSVAGNPAWASALRARRRVYEAGVPPTEAATVLLEQCALGFVVARAVRMQRADSGRPPHWTAEEREWDVPRWFWSSVSASAAASKDWERGVFAGRVTSPAGDCWIALTGVHFWSEALDQLYPEPGRRAAAASAPTTDRQTSPGGRPPASYWDELWCAVWAQVYRGELNPKTQADIERAMLDWAVANGHELGESTAKPRARKMFLAMKVEGENLKNR
jgi:hypothetical protein